MSYDVTLYDPSTGNVFDYGELFEEGGTRVVGGTSRCELNITYNYSEVFGSLVRDLDGCVASNTLDKLRSFVEMWKDAKPYEKDYWAPTPGNAVQAIKRLLLFAEKHPSGVWEVR